MSKKYITYEFPVLDWLFTGMYKQRIQSAIELIKSNEPIEELEIRDSNKNYLQKTLKEEIKFQVFDSKDPLKQIIMNAIDAIPQTNSDQNNNDYVIDIISGKKAFNVIDHGKGITLKEIIFDMIFPNQSSKEKTENIGWRGVGLLSSLKYCLDEPKKAHIIAETETKDGRWVVDFYSKSENIKDLTMSITQKKKKNRTGTHLRITKTMPSPINIQNYVMEHFSELPQYNARIIVNGNQANKGHKSQWTQIPIEFDSKGKNLTQIVGLKSKHTKGKISLTSNGIKVRDYNNLPRNINSFVISFPNSVDVVEGWDDFKKNENYDMAVESSFDALYKHYKKIDMTVEKIITDEKIQEIGEVVGHMLSAFRKYNIEQIPGIEKIRNDFMADKSYVISKENYDQLKLFFGEDIKNKCLILSDSARTHWEHILSSYTKIIHDTPIIKRISFDKSEIEEISKSYQNLIPIINIIKHKYNNLVLVDGPTDSKLPFFKYDVGFSNDLYINVNHEIVTGEFNHARTYNLLSELYQNNFMNNFVNHKNETAIRTELHNVPTLIKENEKNK